MIYKYRKKGKQGWNYYSEKMELTWAALLVFFLPTIQSISKNFVSLLILLKYCLFST